MPDSSRIVSVRLSESELTALNLLMEKQGYKGLGELLGAVASGKFKVGLEEMRNVIEDVLRSYYVPEMIKHEKPLSHEHPS